MELRSTNVLGFVHFQGDVVSNVGSSQGVQLTSTGSQTPTVQAFGDGATIGIALLPKGAGDVTLGTTGGQLVLDSTRTFIGDRSTSGIAYVQRYRIDWTMPALSSNPAAGASVDTTLAVTGATTDAHYLIQQTQVWNSTLTVGIIVTARCSTAGELRISAFNNEPTAISGSTVSANLLQYGW